MIYDRYGLYGVGHPAGADLLNHPPDYNDVVWRRIAEAGATSVRMAASWREIEAKKGKYDWSNLEKTLKYCKVYPWIRPYVLVVNTPGWARPDGKPSHYPPMPEAIADWKKFCKALGERYKGVIKHYEIWNEQNGFGWEAPPYNQPERYMPIMEAAWDGLKEADPDCIISLGGLDNAAGYSPIFTKGAYDLRRKKYGDRKMWEAFGDHPYGNTQSMIDKLRAIKGIAASYGDGDVEFWLTEYGFTLEHISEEEQAAELTRYMTTLILDEEFSYVTETNYLAVGDFEGNYLNFGLCDANLRPRPAFYAYQRLPRPGKIVISDIHLRHLDSTSVRISWRTDTDAASTLEINGVELSSQQPRREHYIIATSLNPNSKYQYRIKATAAGFPQAETLDYEFTTLASEALRNPGFEEGFTAEIANGWECLGKNFCYDSGRLEGKLKQSHSGGHAQCIFADGAVGRGIDDAVAAQASVEIGKTYTFSAWTYAVSEDGDGYIDRKVGIDPTGGLDPKSPSIVWSEPRAKVETWEKQSASAVAQSRVITVFAYAVTTRINGDKDYFFVDDAELGVE